MESKKSSKSESLLEKKWFKDRRNFIIYMILTFPTICLFVLVLLAFLRKKREYVGVKGLRDHGKVQILKRIVMKKIAFKDQLIAHKFAIFAMADLDCEGCAQFIYQLFTKPRPKYYSESERITYLFNQKQYLPVYYKEALMFIAKKRAIPYSELINFLKRESKKQKVKQLEEEINTSELRIPITKSYVLDIEPENKKSMITKLVLDFKKDEIIACPYCGNMAEKNVMADWLVNEKSCPICKESLSIDECPIVVVKN